MSVGAGFVVPHPPLLLPAVGGASLDDVRATASALKSLRGIVDATAPRALIFISPHSPIIEGSFAVRTGECLRGSFSRFGSPELDFTINNDLDMVEMITRACLDRSVPMKTIVPSSETELDWGVLVPYYYFGQSLPIVALSISMLPLAAHYDLGRAVGAAAASIDGDYIFVASGDLSHRLTHEASDGFSRLGASFDGAVTDILATGRLDSLLGLDDEMTISAGECGLRSFVTLAGALAGADIKPRLLSYEGPFGVGYAVASFETREERHV